MKSDTPLPASISAADPVDILLVDDQPARLLAYRAILAPLGENLIEASSGALALKHLMERECALILLDVNMPGMDGFETASMIHQHPRFEKTPIIFVTAVNISDMDRMRGYKLGAVDYVTVPIIPEILRSKVVVLAELYRKRRDLQVANQRLEAANEALRVEKSRELGALNESLRIANNALAARNVELQAQVAERVAAELRLLEVNRRKDEFLATLAHELRNPLASLGNALNAYQLAQPPDPLHDAMQRQQKLLVRLIDDLLDIARINRGKLTVQRAPTTLDAILNSAIEISMPLLLADRHRLEVRAPTQDIALYADHDRLSQVFANLLNNAAKYSPADSVIELVAGGDEKELEIAVVDNGIGLAAGQAGEIFEAFVQVDTSLERSRGGLGIGLTLVRRIVELHGGRIAVHSDGLGRGTRFTVALPVEAVPAAAAAAAEADHATPRVSCRALIVDDNHDSADTMAMMLSMLGHETRCVYDPRQAFEAVESYDPDIVFLDIGMPGLSGYDVARSLRGTPRGIDLTLVAVTGWGHADDRRRTAEAGFDHHLVKPAEMAAISTICNRITPRSKDSV
ncbi:MAG TPA: response regulator [Rhodanobacteraceae bacterium]|nr:response regulator [Rhodanobacteraceae bacterium]